MATQQSVLAHLSCVLCNAETGACNMISLCPEALPMVRAGHLETMQTGGPKINLQNVSEGKIVYKFGKKMNKNNSI